jgi:two-component system, response regulator YesN
MPRVVIVDDEKIVRLGIKSLIAEASPGSVVAGMFANGKDALEFCLRDCPDVVLTDIKMPVMDGLELIERLRAACPRSRIAVLSCHDDYRFVRSAFRLGAEEYILKNEAQASEIAELLARLSPGPASKGTGEPPKADPRDLSDLFDERGAPTESALAALALLATAEPASRYAVASLSFKSAYDESFRALPWRPEPYSLLETVQDAFALLPGSIALRTGPERFACLFRHGGEGCIRRREDSERALRRLLEAVGAYINRPAVIGVSARALPLAQIGTAFSEAWEASSEAFYRDGCCLLYKEEQPRMDGTEEASLDSSRDASKDGPSFGIEASGALEPWLCESRRWFALLKERGRPRPEAAKRAALVAVINLERRMALAIGGTLPGRDEDELGLVGRIDSASALEAWVESRLRAAWARVEGSRGGSTLIGAVRRLVEEEYASDIGLDGTARRFNVSKNYLCLLFRRETGTNFVNYLNQIRIARAKELLVGTSLSVKEVAARVGYKNPNYFSRMFKRLVGKTVTEFKDGI